MRLSSERSDREMGQQELCCELCAPRCVSSSASPVFELLMCAARVSKGCFLNGPCQELFLCSLTERLRDLWS